MQQLECATPKRFLPTILCCILRPPFPLLEPPLLPNAHISTNRNSATNRRCGHPVFSEQAQKSANWPSNGLFLPCVEFRWTGREERCRKCNTESRRGKFPLNAAVCRVCVCVILSACCAQAYFYVYLWVCMCTLHCNQMRVGFYNMSVLCLGKKNCPCVCLYNCCVCLSPHF